MPFGGPDLARGLPFENPGIGVDNRVILIYSGIFFICPDSDPVHSLFAAVRHSAPVSKYYCMSCSRWRRLG